VASALLFQKESSESRFVGGSLGEAESLLGSPLPLLPPPEFEEGRAVFLVKFHPRLRTLLQRYLQGLLGQIGFESPTPRREGGRRDGAERDQVEYEAALGRVLHSARSVDRRQGLTNLFWLAHTRDVSVCLKEMESKSPAIRKLKYSLHPLLSSFYRRVEHQARRDFEKAQPEQATLVAGRRENTGLVDALIDDGFSFTEVSITGFDFNQFLASNKRYRIAADVFFEIYQILLRDTERRLREGDRGLLARVARHLPDLPREQYPAQSSVVKIMMNTHVMPYLLGDPWNAGARILASSKVRTEVERRGSAESIDAFLELVAGVKRFELLSLVRDRVALLGERDLEDKASRGLRIYEFGEAAQVVNSAVNATVLFLDLRGFTKSSEGQISERDLTRELYTVFDAFVPLITRFGGIVDKFLGDGIMVTYGTRHADPLDPLNALRTAVLCQETLRRMREEGKSCYKMGIAIHYGRVYVARFIADEQEVQVTVIGRNVNLAGRLSSAAKKPLEEDEEGIEMLPPGPVRASGLVVTLDSSGMLFNEGVAISRDMLVQLESHLPLVHRSEDGGSVMEYFDESIGRRLVIRYAGDAKFKGVRSSFPVYEVDYEV
jgi:class 3 adenylate cyclase